MSVLIQGVESQSPSSKPHYSHYSDRAITVHWSSKTQFCVGLIYLALISVSRWVCICGSLFLTRGLMNWLNAQLDAVPNHLLDRFCSSETEILFSLVIGYVICLGGSSIGLCYFAVNLLIETQHFLCFQDRYRLKVKLSLSVNKHRNIQKGVQAQLHTFLTLGQG